MNLASSVTDIKGVGPALSASFEKAGIKAVGDLLEFFPKRYDDFSEILTIDSIEPGLVSVKVWFENVSTKRVRRGLHLTQADACDETGRVRVVWFNQPYRASQLSKSYYLMRGNYEFKNNRLQFVNPSVVAFDEQVKQQEIVPSYSERLGIKSAQLRKLIEAIFKTDIVINETLPQYVIDNYSLMDLGDAYKNMHLPEDIDAYKMAKRRFAFEELFVVMAAAKTIRSEVEATKAVSIPFKLDSAKQFVENLPFKLTDAQRKVVWQIYKDIDSTKPMNRLVEGDVGSGKTVVASMALLMALESGMQAAVIAPTELLARQHFETIKSVFSHTSHANDVRLLIGSLTKKQKETIKKDISSGQANCLVGTHAIFEKDVKWKNLAIVIIDEQHRFGVEQRQRLHSQDKHVPHILCMTATPIPRSLALTVYGELDISILDEYPKHRAGIDTAIVSPNSTAQMYEAINSKILNGRQAYIVCPLISESTSIATHSAEETYEKLSKGVFKHLKVGLLHGKMSGKDKDLVMSDFKNGQIDVLVATTVIEVGVDVPNATEMVILGADRFGLAQLHQLRGRVGRGEHRGSCYLVMSDSTRPSQRMRAIESTTNGFELAEYDLEIRGPGAIYGTMQHGSLDLRHVKFDDHVLISEAREAIKQFDTSSKNMVKYPQLAKKVAKTLQVTYLN